MQVDVLIPACEETFLLAKHSARLSGYVATVLPIYQDILLAHNKDRWAQTARRLGIPVPVSCSIEELRTGQLLGRAICAIRSSSSRSRAVARGAYGK